REALVGRLEDEAETLLVRDGRRLGWRPGRFLGLVWRNDLLVLQDLDDVASHRRERDEDDQAGEDPRYDPAPRDERGTHGTPSGKSACLRFLRSAPQQLLDRPPVVGSARSSESAVNALPSHPPC